MILLILLSLSPIFADEEAIEKYCFEAHSRTELALREIKTISVPSDRIEKTNNCLIITMRPHRRELIQKFLYSSFPDMRVDFSSASLDRKPCDLKLEKLTTKESNSSEIKIPSDNVLEASTTSANQKETMQIKTQNEFEVVLDETKILGECKYITSSRYEIKLSVLREKKEFVSPTNIPKDSSSLTLKTELQLTKGERIEIGQVLQQKETENKSINLPTDLGASQNSRSFSQKVYLSIDN
jgi:hypothetical protein